MACALYTKKWTKVIAESEDKNTDELPSWDEFSSMVDKYNSFHLNNPVFFPFENMTLKEAYEKEHGWVMDVFRDIINANFEDATNKQEQAENAYWGCAGKFDRHILNYFHDYSDKWCYDGLLPPVPNNCDG